MKITFPGGKRVDANYSGFDIKTDQPIRAGGENSSPAPFDLFLTSIGTCAGINVLSFCQRRNIPTEKVHLNMSYNYNIEKRLIDLISIVVYLPEDFPQKYVKPVLKAAEYCAVTKHLFNPPKFELKTEVNTDN